MIENYEVVKAKVIQTYREINDLDVALALHGVEHPEDIQKFSDDENFIAQYKLIHAQFLRELLGNMKRLSKGASSLALSATKSLLQTYHPAKFGTDGRAENGGDNNPLPPEREMQPIDVDEETQDPEMRELLENALKDDNPDPLAESKDESAETQTKINKLREEMDKRNRSAKNGRAQNGRDTEEYFEVDISKEKRKAIARLHR